MKYALLSQTEPAIIYLTRKIRIPYGVADTYILSQGTLDATLKRGVG